MINRSVDKWSFYITLIRSAVIWYEQHSNHSVPGIILYMCPANERQCYIVMSSHWLVAYSKWSLCTCIICELFMLVILYCSGFVWFLAFVTDLLPYRPYVFLFCVSILHACMGLWPLKWFNEIWIWTYGMTWSKWFNSLRPTEAYMRR